MALQNKAAVCHAQHMLGKNTVQNRNTEGGRTAGVMKLLWQVAMLKGKVASCVMLAGLLLTRLCLHVSKYVVHASSKRQPDFKRVKTKKNLKHT
jgi:hypothetical protein